MDELLRKWKHVTTEEKYNTEDNGPVFSLRGCKNLALPLQSVYFSPNQKLHYTKNNNNKNNILV